MSDLDIVEIPADVKDNSPHSIRIQWRSVRDAWPDEIDSGKRSLSTFGYTLYEWDDVDADGIRVTMHRFVSQTGDTVDLFATYYYTRVKCTDCEYSYATRYIAVTDSDGITHRAAPFCDEHGRVVKRITNQQAGFSWHESEPLLIGQHD